MRDEGLDEAIRVAGGVGALARKIGISQPSVSNWARIPAERVLTVEAATGVDRAILRPDLYSVHAGAGGDVGHGRGGVATLTEQTQRRVGEVAPGPLLLLISETAHGRQFST